MLPPAAGRMHVSGAEVRKRSGVRGTSVVVLFVADPRFASASPSGTAAAAVTVVRFFGGISRRD